MGLAEVKNKQKWSLNPRGNLWANDTQKFGLKLMEKMGYEQGKVRYKSELVLKVVRWVKKDVLYNLKGPFFENLLNEAQL